MKIITIGSIVTHYNSIINYNVLQEIEKQISIYAKHNELIVSDFYMPDSNNGIFYRADLNSIKIEQTRIYFAHLNNHYYVKICKPGKDKQVIELLFEDIFNLNKILHEPIIYNRNELINSILNNLKWIKN